jgi:hypothetical protein
MNPKAVLIEVIDAIAQEAADRHIRDSITVGDASRHLDDEAIVAWTAWELGLRTPQELLADIVSELTDGQAKDLLMSDRFREHLKEWAAKDLLSDCEERTDAILAEREPELPFDEPVAADRRAMARIANQQGAYERTGRTWPL